MFLVSEGPSVTIMRLLRGVISLYFRDVTGREFLFFMYKNWPIRSFFHVLSGRRHFLILAKGDGWTVVCLFMSFGFAFRHYVLAS